MWDTATWDVSLWDAVPVVGGHFGFDEKKRGARWKKEQEDKERRKHELIAAFAGLDAQGKTELAPLVGSGRIDWDGVAQDAALSAKVMAAMHDDEDDIETLLVMGVL